MNRTTSQRREPEGHKHTAESTVAPPVSSPRWRTIKRKFYTGKKCLRCGVGADLQLHHRNPEDKVGHNVWSWSEERRAREIAKCDVLCASCHRRHHAQLRREAMSHGTVWKYKLGCRCNACKASNAKKKRDQYHRNKGER